MPPKNQAQGKPKQGAKVEPPKGISPALEHFPPALARHQQNHHQLLVCHSERDASFTPQRDQANG